jgi:hypothetical protein
MTAHALRAAGAGLPSSLLPSPLRERNHGSYALPSHCVAAPSLRYYYVFRSLRSANIDEFVIIVIVNYAAIAFPGVRKQAFLEK